MHLILNLEHSHLCLTFSIVPFNLARDRYHSSLSLFKKLFMNLGISWDIKATRHCFWCAWRLVDKVKGYIDKLVLTNLIVIIYHDKTLLCNYAWVNRDCFCRWAVHETSAIFAIYQLPQRRGYATGSNNQLDRSGINLSSAKLLKEARELGTSQ